MSIYPEHGAFLSDQEPASANELEVFRSNWLQELQQHVRLNASQVDQNSSSDEKTNLARSLYQIGIAEEKAGNPYKAVNFYAKACRLCPDIEKEFVSYSDSPDMSNTSSIPQTPAFVSDEEDEVEDDDAQTSEVNTVAISDQMEGCSLGGPPPGTKASWLCDKQWSSEMVHLSDLPWDVLVHILRLVTFPDYDFRSLEQSALVSKGFYYLSRNSGLYKTACVRMWGDKVPPKFQGMTWRSMFIRRPRVSFNGVYISKLCYTRQGERAFDSSYDIFVNVEYYRYLRVFPDGTALMYTSPEDPRLVVPKLRYQDARISGIKVGRFKLQGDKLKILLTEVPNENQSRVTKSRRAVAEKEYRNSFYVTLAIAPLGKRPSSKLTWLSYTVQNSSYINGDLIATIGPTEYNINNAQFKPFLFSRVKSYTGEHVSSVPEN